MNLPVLADQLLPFLLPLIQQVAAPSTSATSGGASMTQHDLSGGLHAGVLADSQAPQFLKMDGSRTLIGSLAVEDGVLIDGVDLSVHAGDPAAHHAPATAGALIAVTGQQVALANGNQQYQVPVTGATPFAPAWMTLAGFAGNGLAFTGGQFAVGVANTGAAGLSVEADLVRLTSSSAPGAAANVLATDSSGYLSLVRLTLSDRLRSPLLDTAAGNLTLQPAGDVMLSPAGGRVRLAASSALQSDNYASQTTGMRVSYAGEGDFRYLFVDEMHAKSFIADLEQALAGGQIISKSVAVLAANFVLPAAGATGTLRVRDLPSAPNMAVFQSGDFVGLRSFSRAAGSLTIGWAWGTVTSYADGTGSDEGTQTWTFTRHASTPGAASGTIAAESLVLDFGVTGNGFYEVNAIDGVYGVNSPYWRIVTWATHPATQTVRVQGGNLRGLFGVANEYGLYAGAGVTTSDAYLRISNTEVGLYNLPLRLYTGSTERVHIAAHNDVWIGPSTSDRRLEWNGSTLTVRGAIVVQAGSSGIGTFTDAGALATANSTSWATQVSGRPTELTDGRITTAISSGGVIQSRVDPGVAWGANPGAGVAGLLLGSDYMGYWSGTAWRSYIDSNGNFYFAGNTGARIEYNASAGRLRGLNSGGTEQWYAESSSGELRAGGGNVWLNANGVSLVGASYASASNYDLLATRTQSRAVNFNISSTNEWSIWNWYNSTTNMRALSVSVLPNNGVWQTLLRFEEVGNAVTTRINSDLTVEQRLLAVTVGYDWSDLTPDAGWANYDTANYPSFAVRRFGDLVSIKGVVIASVAKSAYAQLYQLAAAYRPTRRRLFTCWSSAGDTRVDVAADGRIYIERAIPQNGTVSVEITYFTGG